MKKNIFILTVLMVLIFSGSVEAIEFVGGTGYAHFSSFDHYFSEVFGFFAGLRIPLGESLRLGVQYEGFSQTERRVRRWWWW